MKVNNDNKKSVDEFTSSSIGCSICGCMPKPDEWSAQVEGICFDCG